MAAASRATMSSGWRSAQPRLRPYAARTVSKISSLRRWRTLFSCCFRRRAHIIGVSVRDTTSDSRIAADSVSANSRNRRPTMSPMNRIGMKTDRKSTRLNSSHGYISYAVSGLKKKNSYVNVLVGRTHTRAAVLMRDAHYDGAPPPLESVHVPRPDGLVVLRSAPDWPHSEANLQ